MSAGAPRAFDDARWPDPIGFADCFLCGLPVDPLDANRGSYDEPPAGPPLKLHLPCLNGRTMLSVSFYYRKAIAEMGDFQFRRTFG